VHDHATRRRLRDRPERGRHALLVVIEQRPVRVVRELVVDLVPEHRGVHVDRVTGERARPLRQLAGPAQVHDPGDAGGPDRRDRRGGHPGVVVGAQQCAGADPAAVLRGQPAQVPGIAAGGPVEDHRAGSVSVAAGRTGPFDTVAARKIKPVSPGVLC